jgi:thiamine pyrophosphate-dependent acetolactate synthase large subunit-like protein
MTKTVADILVGTLEQIGIKHIFALIGDSLNPLADSIRRSSIVRQSSTRSSLQRSCRTFRTSTWR